MDFNNEIGIYEKALDPELSIFEKIHTVRELGFDGLQLCIDANSLLPYIWSDKFCNLVLECCRREGIKIFSVSLSAHRYYSLAAVDVRVRDFAVDLLIKSILFSKKVGAKAVMLAGYDTYNTPAPKNSWSIFKENLTKVVSIAEREGIKLPIEIVDRNFINNCKKALKMVKEIDSCCLAIYYDTANCIASGYNPEQQLKYSEGLLYGVHLKDTKDGDYKSNLPLGSGDVDFEIVFKKLRDIGFKGEVILENWYDNIDCLNKYSKDLMFIRKLVDNYLR